MKKYICVIISIIILGFSCIIIFNYKDKKEQILVKVDRNKQVNMEKYIYNVICNEMSEYYDYEAVKAFCVVVRTNIIYNLVEDMAEAREDKIINIIDVDMPYSENNFAIKSKENIVKAINETKGEVCLYKNRIVYLPYHKVSSGRTDNKQTNKGNVIPYLKMANCSEDIENKDYLKIYYYDIQSNEDKLKENISNKFKNSHITYSLDEVDNRLRVVTKGTGHNYGMSLYNAYIMSKKGYNYGEILNKFYKNVRIARVYE